MSDLDQYVLFMLPFLLLLPLMGVAHAGSISMYPNWCTKCARDSCPVAQWYKDMWRDPHDIPLCHEEIAQVLQDWIDMSDHVTSCAPYGVGIRSTRRPRYSRPRPLRVRTFKPQSPG